MEKWIFGYANVHIDKTGNDTGEVLFLVGIFRNAIISRSQKYDQSKICSSEDIATPHMVCKLLLGI